MGGILHVGRLKIALKVKTRVIPSHLCVEIGWLIGDFVLAWRLLGSGFRFLVSVCGERLLAHVIVTLWPLR